MDSSSSVVYTTTAGSCCTPADTKITPIMEQLLSDDTRKLIRAGFLTTKLELTHEGKEALWGLLFADKHKEFVKLADAKIDADFGF